MMAKENIAMDISVQNNVSKDTANEKHAEVNLDTLISAAGEMGRYQILMLFSIFPYFMFSVFVYYSQIFITEVPDHWCWIPELANLTGDQRRSLAIPKNADGSGYSQCYYYDANWTEVLSTGLETNDTWMTATCQNGWEFDRTKIPYPTISSDFEWVCERRSYQANAQVIFFVGSFVGGILIGWIADRYGRIPAVIFSNLLGCIGGFASTFVMNFTQFSICRFIMGMAYDTCMTMPFLIVFEYISPKYRSICANTSFAIFYCSFATSLPFIALSCGHWRTICIITSLPLGLAIFSPIFYPESPRWLLSKGRTDEAIDKVSVIARRNRRELPQKLIDQFRENFSRNTKQEDLGITEIFKRPLLRRTLIIVCFVYMCSEVVFDGLVRNLELLDFDFFQSFAASSATEFPSILLCAFTVDFFGKRWMMFVVMTISSLFSFLTVFVENGVPSLICALVARFTVNISYNIMLQWAAEVLPTPVRGSGTAFIHICANLGYIISSLNVYLKTYVTWLPFVMIGILAGIGGLMALLIPETTMKEMPHTFDDAEELIKSWKMWDIVFWRRIKKKSQGHDNQGCEL